MSFFHSSFWEDRFAPKRNNNLKKVIVLSAITGVVSSAIASFFSKKENRNNIKKNFDKVSEESKIATDRITNNAKNMAEDFNYNMKRKAGDNDQDGNSKYYRLDSE